MQRRCNMFHRMLHRQTGVWSGSHRGVVRVRATLGARVMLHRMLHPMLHLAGGCGDELVESLAKRSNGVLAMGQSTLYPLLYNLEAKGLIASRVDNSGPRPRRYYRLTDKGRKRLVHDQKQWTALRDAMTGLGIGPQPAGVAL